MPKVLLPFNSARPRLISVALVSLLLLLLLSGQLLLMDSAVKGTTAAGRH